MSRARLIEKPCPGRSRGAALLLLLLAAVLAFGAILAASLAGTRPEIERQRRSLEALAQAKQAVIAWALMQGDKSSTENSRPGSLPCPDRNHFGTTESGNASGSCSVGGGTSIGRLPWKSLGMDRLRDGYGESLWYAISDNFRYHNLAKAAINSDVNSDANNDRKDSFQLYAADGATLLTSVGEELAAVIFAPGPPLPGQDRAAHPDAASSYLEAFAGKNNASASAKEPFIMGPARDARGDRVVNDLVIGISARELVAALEKRALSEAQAALGRYVAETGQLPNPAPHDDSSCKSPITNVESAAPCASNQAPIAAECASDETSATECAGGDTPRTCFGRLPEDVLSEDLSVPVARWFTQNGWGRVMIYAISDAKAGCPNPLTLDGTPVSYVLIAPGTARAGQKRPSVSLADYLEDANTGAWSGNPDFTAPDATKSNDQLRAE